MQKCGSHHGLRRGRCFVVAARPTSKCPRNRPGIGVFGSLRPEVTPPLGASTYGGPRGLPSHFGGRSSSCPREPRAPLSSASERPVHGTPHPFCARVRASLRSAHADTRRATTRHEGQGNIALLTLPCAAATCPEAKTSDTSTTRTKKSRHWPVISTVFSQSIAEGVTEMC